jgi:hypothetical protein
LLILHVVLKVLVGLDLPAHLILHHFVGASGNRVGKNRDRPILGALVVLGWGRTDA